MMDEEVPLREWVQGKTIPCTVAVEQHPHTGEATRAELTHVNELPDGQFELVFEIPWLGEGEIRRTVSSEASVQDGIFIFGDDDMELSVFLVEM